jgi:hypothetical protein
VGLNRWFHEGDDRPVPKSTTGAKIFFRTRNCAECYEPPMKLTTLALVLTASLSSAALADTAPAPAPSKPAPAPKAPPKEAPKTDAPTAEVEKFLVFFDKLVDIAVVNKDDCAKMATGLNGHIDTNKALLDKAAEAQAKGQKLPDAARERMMKSAGKLMGAMQKCGNDPGVQAALKRLPRAGGTTKPAK